ncbi:MAG: hydantoinase/oxoprolinase N-terminal domain-containing protein, partial [Alphaproteobacteria bacterium]|nr:hydantoinase/oxoprolinase N-terminal domain-containing protein [Alphaproteobacteria bacterium]
MSYRLGVDIGGTFTDFALFDEARGEMFIHKQLTTQDDPSRAVLEGCTYLLAQHGVDIAEVETIAHGTTLVTNAVIERRGARTGMLVSEGFR